MYWTVFQMHVLLLRRFICSSDNLLVVLPVLRLGLIGRFVSFDVSGYVSHLWQSITHNVCQLITTAFLFITACLTIGKHPLRIFSPSPSKPWVLWLRWYCPLQSYLFSVEFVFLRELLLKTSMEACERMARVLFQKRNRYMMGLFQTRNWALLCALGRSQWSWVHFYHIALRITHQLIIINISVSWRNFPNSTVYTCEASIQLPAYSFCVNFFTQSW